MKGGRYANSKMKYEFLSVASHRENGLSYDGAAEVTKLWNLRPPKLTDAKNNPQMVSLGDVFRASACPKATEMQIEK